MVREILPLQMEKIDFKKFFSLLIRFHALVHNPNSYAFNKGKEGDIDV